jgi:hypothetical protein
MILILKKKTLIFNDSKTVWNSGRFGPNLPHLELVTDYPKQFKTVQKKPYRLCSRQFFTISRRFERNPKFYVVGTCVWGFRGGRPPPRWF